MKDLILNKAYKKGDSGPKVRLIQEWLNLHGIRIVIDGDYGAATDWAVRGFQMKAEITVDGVAGNNTFTELTKPMRRAMEQITKGITTLGSLVLAYAQLHLSQHPREVGGQNRGPWVRLYMDGNDGAEWAWCAGFASYIMRQACDSLGVPTPIISSYSVDDLVSSAKLAGIFVSENAARDRTNVLGGSLFLVRRTPTDWTHVGIVGHREAETFETIEGNTNDEGHREGYEVCERTRSYDNKDFIVWR